MLSNGSMRLVHKNTNVRTFTFPTRTGRMRHTSKKRPVEILSKDGTKTVFESISEAARALGTSPCQVRRMTVTGKVRFVDEPRDEVEYQEEEEKFYNALEHQEDEEEEEERVLKPPKEFFKIISLMVRSLING